MPRDCSGVPVRISITVAKLDANQIAAWQRQMQLGTQAFQQGRLGDAIACYQQATAAAPRRIESWINLGSAQLQHGAFQAAIASLEQATKCQADHPLTPQLLGDAWRGLGNIEAAIDQYRTAVSIERSPMALNRLACALRTQAPSEEPRKLYLEAMQRAPQFSLARVNYATELVACGDIEKAHEQLALLKTMPLSPPEQQEIESIAIALSEFERLSPAIRNLLETDNNESLISALANTPSSALSVDAQAMQSVESYVKDSVLRDTTETLSCECLPEDWALIEAAFMVPAIESVSDYVALKTQFESQEPLAGVLLETWDMWQAVQASRGPEVQLLDPMIAELHLRHWHALATRTLDHVTSGHFKQVQNWSSASPNHHRVIPSKASGTLRHFFAQHYEGLPQGLAGTAAMYLALLDLHPFSDGNSRVAMTWVNRELEWQGYWPMVFDREIGLHGLLGKAVLHARHHRGDLTGLIEVFSMGQQAAKQFVADLAPTNQAD